MIATAPRIKVCGVRTDAGVEAAIDGGADAIGFNFVVGSPRQVDDFIAADLVRRARDHVACVGLFVGVELDAVPALVARAGRIGLDALQLHGGESSDVVRAVETAGIACYAARRLGELGDLDRPEPIEALAGASRWALALVDAKSNARLLGGTGLRVSAALTSSAVARCRVMLAGGLDPQNVADIIASLRPVAVDAASGLERAPGMQDPRKVFAFCRSARAAFDAARS